MVASKYIEDAELYDLGGIPPGSLANPARVVADINVEQNLFTVDGHGLSLDRAVQFRADDAGSLPAELATGVTYYAIPVSDSTFRVAAAPAGAAINITTVGDRVLLVVPLPVGDWIEWASAIVDDVLPAHAVPLTGPIAVTIKTVVATLAAHRGMAATGKSTTGQEKLIEWAQETVKRWQKGVPVRGADAPTSATNLAVKGSAPAGGWTPADGSIP